MKSRISALLIYVSICTLIIGIHPVESQAGEGPNTSYNGEWTVIEANPLKRCHQDDCVIVSADSSGQTHGGGSNPDISANGRYVVFTSQQDSLVGGGTGLKHIYRKDMWTGAITRVSSTGSGRPANGVSDYPSISSDGRFVAFTSWASDLVVGDTNGKSDVFLADLVAKSVKRISVGPGGSQGNGNTYYTDISASGRYVVFESQGTNLIPGDKSFSKSIYVWDAASNGLILASASSEDVNANAGALYPAISANGRFVAFYSKAGNLGPDHLNENNEIYLKDMVTGEVSLASSDSSGDAGTGGSLYPDVSSDGKYVVFETQDDELLKAFGSPFRASLRKNMTSGELRQVAGEESYYPTISSEGSVVVYVSASGGFGEKRYSSEDIGSIVAWPRATSINVGNLAKVAGLVKGPSGAGLAGIPIYIDAFDFRVGTKVIGTPVSTETGYFQLWYKPTRTLDYFAVYEETNYVQSNRFSIEVYPQVVAWNPYPWLTYSGWTRVHGLLKGQNGQALPATSVYLQVWSYSKKKWVWKATYRTTPSGYFDFWFKPYGTTHYRVATWGSASASKQVTKTVKKKVLLNPGATRLNLGSSTRIQVKVQPGHPGSVGYFQEWDFTTKKWKWIKTLAMDSSSRATYRWKPKTKGWHAIRVHAPRHWDHEENYSAIHWVEVK